ncbi:hypothetical protein [Streptomyces sp. NPDC006875]|uniref:hypothetical protein n=1 Tax=Streptomyces sp. NPDC006875 TaxID=3154781 RepID=UPI003404302A
MVDAEFDRSALDELHTSTVPVLRVFSFVRIGDRRQVVIRQSAQRTVRQEPAMLGATPPSQ